MRIVTLIEDNPGREGCCHEHGLCFYIETRQHTLLMDTGASGAFLENARTLGIDVGQVDTVVLSHGHYDHTGGVMPFAGINDRAVIYLSRNAGGDYYSIRETGNTYIGIDREILKLPQVRLVEGELRIDEELSLFSGITGGRFRAKSNERLLRRDGEVFVRDMFDHEQCLVIEENGMHVLLSGCAHNGILNILDRYEDLYGALPDVVISGFHLIQKQGYAPEDIAVIEETARELLRTGILFYTGHCTGQEPYRIMKSIMGDRLEALRVGEEIRLAGVMCRNPQRAEEELQAAGTETHQRPMHTEKALSCAEQEAQP